MQQAIADSTDLATIDLVVPFTTPELTLAALKAANTLGPGIGATIRLLKIQVVPYPLEPRNTPVPVEFLEAQLSRMPSDLPTRRQVHLAREFEGGLKAALRANSVVLIARKRRPWRTRNERIAASLRRAGFTVLLVSEKGNGNA